MNENRHDCLICGGDLGEPVVAAERMFGMGGEFPYAACRACGCLQICAAPRDLSPYYPADRYYSFSANPLQRVSFQSRPLRARLLGWLQAPALFDRSGDAAAARAGSGIARLRRRPRKSLEWVRYVLRHTPAPSFRMSILDVGCGEGSLLKELAALGFRNLHGADPFIGADGSPHRSIRLHACAIESLPAESRFDLILFNHSLEHIADQHATLRSVERFLTRDGVCRIEVPVAGCEAWETYGAHWSELDAPRHLVLHTEQSMRLLARQCGMEVVDAEYVGTSFEYWGSEMYRRGITLYDEATGTTRKATSVFGEEEMAGFERKAAEANRAGRGGRILFTLQRTAAAAAEAESNARPAFAAAVPLSGVTAR